MALLAMMLHTLSDLRWLGNWPGSTAGGMLATVPGWAVCSACQRQVSIACLATVKTTPITLSNILN
jgi:hypothetical protein